MSHNSLNTRRTKAHLIAVGTSAMAVSGSWLLLRFPPTTNTFYPRCLFFSAFHLECPGCGATRALAALLRGQFQQALHWNAMIVGLLPIIAAFLAVSYYRAIQNADFSWPVIPNRVLAVSLTAVFAFALLRNIPALWPL